MNITITELVISLLVLASFALSIFSFYHIRRLNKLRENLLKNGYSANTIEDNLNIIFKHISVMEGSIRQLQSEVEITENILKKAIQKVSVVKYNSGTEDGGNFSFSTTLLDSNDTGIILTSLYGRQFNRVYVKSIIRGQSQIPLTEEEKTSLNQAAKSQNLDLEIIPE